MGAGGWFIIGCCHLSVEVPNDKRGLEASSKKSVRTGKGWSSEAEKGKHKKPTGKASEAFSVWIYTVVIGNSPFEIE